VFSRLYLGGSFRFKAFLPAAEHAAEIVAFLCKHCIFSVVERIQFPSDPKKEFQDIHALDGRTYCREFLGFTLVACDKQQLEYLDEC